MKESDSPQTVVKRVHHFHHVLVRLVCRLKVAPSSYRFLHFGLPFPPLCAMKEPDSRQTVGKRECTMFITFWSVSCLVFSCHHLRTISFAFAFPFFFFGVFLSR